MNTAEIGTRPNPLQDRADRIDPAPEQRVNIEALKTAVQEYVTDQAIVFAQITNPDHIGSPFWRHLTRHLDDARIPHNDNTLKYAIKQLQAAQPLDLPPYQPIEPIQISITDAQFDHLRQISSPGDLRNGEIKGIFKHGGHLYACIGIGYMNGRNEAHARRLVLRAAHDGPALTHDQASRAAIQDGRRSIYDHLEARLNGREYVLLPGKVEFILDKETAEPLGMSANGREQTAPPLLAQIQHLEQQTRAIIAGYEAAAGPPEIPYILARALKAFTQAAAMLETAEKEAA